MESSKSRSRPEDIFPIFQEAAQSSFEFLITDFGFTLISITTDDSMAFAGMIGCDITYRNKTTEIKVSYTWYDDLRGTPQVICGCLKLKNNVSLEVAEAYNLDMIISARCPDKALGVYPEDPIDRLKHMLRTYGRIIVDCVSSELSGDFSIFPQLRRTLLEELKEAVFLHSGVDADELIEHLERETSE